MHGSSARRLILACFLLSGVAGLIYEIVWTKLLGLVVGNTVFSITTVLTAFMGGLALGSYLAGRVGDRIRNPLRAYGILEILIAAYCVAIPFLIQIAEPLFRAIYRSSEATPYRLNLFRALVAGVILLPPTTLMGATLPILTRFFVSRVDRLGAALGRLYGLNTLGAVLGAFGTGFLLIPSLGVRATVFLGATGSAIAGTGALLLGSKLELRREPAALAKTAGESPGKPPTAPLSGSVRLLLLAFGLAGFASMVYQVAWTRALALTIGSSVYAFSLIVTAFILGLAIGPLVLSRWFDRVRDPAFAFAGVEIAVAVVALSVAPLIGGLPYRIADLVGPRLGSFSSIVATEFAILFVILFLPTFFMGAAFPLVARAATTRLDAVGRSVGTAYAANTLGAILGSFAGGFLLLPSPLRAQGTLFAASALNAVAAVIALFASRAALRTRLVVAAGTAVALVVLMGFAVPRWDPRVLSSGAYLRILPELRTDRATLDRLLAQEKILYYAEGVTATIAVKELPDGTRTLLTNGKVDASTAGDMPTQVLSAHLPLLLHRDPKDVLVVGLGGGATLGSTLHQPVRSVDCVEISTEVVEAADRYFGEVNFGGLHDPRVRLLITDARNHLVMTDRRYDVITSEPSNPWIAGIASLFTREYFAACRSHLNPHGVMCQWVTTTSMAVEDLRMVFATFTETFPQSLLFESILGGDHLMIGFTDEAAIDLDRIASGFAAPSVAEDLGRIGIRDTSDFLAHFVCGPERLRHAGVGSPINTDDNSRLEFSAPKSFYRFTRPDLLQLYLDTREPVMPYFLPSPPASPPPTADSLAGIFEARGEVGKALIELSLGRIQAGEDLLKRALELHPGDAAAVRNLIELYRESARRELNEGRPESALAATDRGLAVDPRSYSILDFRGCALLALGRNQEAEALFRTQIEVRPRSLDARLNHGKAAYRLGRTEEAAADFQKVLEAEPRSAEALFYLGAVNSIAKKYRLAGEYYERALEIEPDNPDFRRDYGMALLLGGRTQDAVHELERAAEQAPQDAETWLALEKGYEQSGNPEGALKARSRAESLRPR